jgi:hypothetical protein
MWPSKEEREYALRKITEFMGFDLKNMTGQNKVDIYANDLFDI